MKVIQPLHHLIHRLAGMACALALCGLQACGGAAGQAEPPLAEPDLPTLTGQVTDGWSPTDVGALQITVKGSVGRARTAEGRRAPSDDGDYLASLDQLSGPYLVSNARNSGAPMYAVATGPGIANLTPLTTLLTAQLLGTDLDAYFTQLGSDGGFTLALDDATIAAAEARVRRYLQREFGLVLPADLGPFVTMAFRREPGDPMYDTLTALVARIGQRGDYRAVVRALAQESARCRIERVVLSAGSTSDDFCPLTRRNVADPEGPGVQILSFANQHGDQLSLRLRGDTLLAIDWTSAEGAHSRCAQAACGGVIMGAAQRDGARSITLTGTVLEGAGGRITLNGTLRSAATGIELPGLPCNDNRFYLVHADSRTAEGYCATPDEFGLGASGFSQPSGATRRQYSFNDGSGGPWLELVTQGTTVVRALLYALDPDTGVITPRFQCLGAGCAGVTLAATTVDTSLGVPIVLQPIRMEQAVFWAVLPDGSLSPTESVSVVARFTGYYVDDPTAPVLQPVACDAPQRVLALPSDQATPIEVCEPADSQGFQLRSSFIDVDGHQVLSLANLMSDGQGGFAAGSAITVTLSAEGSLLSVSFDLFAGPRYRCEAKACGGTVVAPPDGHGERAVSFSGVRLMELGTGGLPADRHTALSGGFLAASPP